MTFTGQANRHSRPLAGVAVPLPALPPNPSGHLNAMAAMGQVRVPMARLGKQINLNRMGNLESAYAQAVGNLASSQDNGHN